MKLLDFTDGYLQQLVACGTFCPGSRERFARLAGQAAALFLQADYMSGETGCIVRLVLEKWNTVDDGHFHIEIGLKEDFSYNEPAYQVIGLQEMQGYVDILSGQEVDVRVNCKFGLPIDALPKRGIVSMLLGVEAEACGAVMRLTGAEMKVSSDEFRSVRWRQAGECLHVWLEADYVLTVDDGYLEHLAALAHTGFQCLILESPRDDNESARAEKPKLPPRQNA